MSETMSNLEALINIGANLAEIAGIASGANCLVWSWMPAAGHYGGYSLRMAGIALACVVGGLAAPGIANMAAAVNQVLGLVSWPLAIAIIVGGFYNFMTPYRLAERLNHPQASVIKTLNCIAFVVPILFPVSLGMVSFAGKAEIEKRAAALAELEREGGGSDR